MKIINFNRRDKVDNTGLLNTYIDWNKQYCYDLSRKITSLYDYMMWNYPEYFIFNSPNSLNGLDDFEPYKSLVDKSEEPRLVQPYEAHVAFNSDNPNLSIFFPSRLNYHQGFYNQSNYGDAILMCWYNNQWISTTNNPYYNLTNHLFSNNKDGWYPEDLNIENYNVYTKNNDENKTIDRELTGTEKDNKTTVINIGLKCFDIKVEVSSELLGINYITHTSYDYKEDSGDLYVSWGYLTSITPLHAYLTITYTQAYEWKKQTSISELFETAATEGRLTYIGNNECLLIHKTQYSQYGHTVLMYETNQIKPTTIINQSTYTAIQNKDDIYDVVVYTPGVYDNLVKEEDINIASYINFPSGYVCILNKQPAGVNNEQNSIKNNLSNYLIAPMGNGGYYDIWWNNNILQANYKANELNNFSSKLTINLAQNCRYVNPSNDTFSFTGEQLNVTIPNWYIDNETVKPQLCDKHKNIWTGQEDLIAQPHFNGEKIFADMQYDLFRSVIKQQNVHNFNAHVDESFSLTKVNLLIY